LEVGRKRIVEEEKADRKELMGCVYGYKNKVYLGAI